MNSTNKKIGFYRSRNVALPRRANSHDAGSDFFIPYFDPQFLVDLIKKNPDRRIKYRIDTDKDTNDTVLYMTVMPHERINIPSGIHVDIKDKNTVLQATDKSGICDGKTLRVTCNTVDADYRGEIHIGLENYSDEPVTIWTGLKAVQFIHRHYIDTDWDEYNEYTWNKLEEEEPTDRGSGAFSSTGLSAK